jgi:syntaxin 7
VKTTVEETSDKFKEIGEGVKKITTWPDVGVCLLVACESMRG